MELIKPYKLTPVEKLSSMVEHRTKFNLDFCELNVFETHQQAQDFHLKFNGFTITSMLRGKKIMHLDGMDAFDYVPGETVLAPSNTLMRIDFPEAYEEKPTQCTALVIDNDYLFRQLTSINEQNKLLGVSADEWKIDFSELILKNSGELAKLSTKLLKVFSSDDPFKEYEADIIMRQLVLNMLRLQHLTTIKKSHKEDVTATPFHAVLGYIAKHLHADIKIEDLCKVACMSKSSFYRSFTDEFGITPAQLILDERIEHAKKLLNNDEISVKEVAFASGFNDPNYFSRIFHKKEGVSPSDFRAQTLS